MNSGLLTQVLRGLVEPWSSDPGPRGLVEPWSADPGPRGLVEPWSGPLVPAGVQGLWRLCKRRTGLAGRSGFLRWSTRFLRFSQAVCVTAPVTKQPQTKDSNISPYAPITCLRLKWNARSFVLRPCLPETGVCVLGQCVFYLTVQS